MESVHGVFRDSEQSVSDTRVSAYLNLDLNTHVLDRVSFSPPCPPSW